MFEDKKVAIFGLGNAAMETADALKSYTAFVHAFPGRGTMKFPHFAYETRYVMVVLLVVAMESPSCPPPYADVSA